MSGTPRSIQVGVPVGWGLVISLIAHSFVSRGGSGLWTCHAEVLVWAAVSRGGSGRILSRMDAFRSGIGEFGLDRLRRWRAPAWSPRGESSLNPGVSSVP